MSKVNNTEFFFRFVPGFIEMQDLLHGFTDPNVIDIKMGTRTFLESEVTNTTGRSDLYQKVCKNHRILFLSKQLQFYQFSVDGESRSNGPN